LDNTQIYSNSNNYHQIDRNIIKTKFELFAVKTNLETYFHNRFKGFEVNIKPYLEIKDYNIYLIEDKNNDSSKYSKAILESNDIFNKILTSINEKDSLFNYLLFLNNPIRKNIEDNTPCFMFTEENTYENLKQILRNNKYKGFILFNYLEFNLIDNSGNKLINDLDFSLVNASYLDGICLINKNSYDYLIKDNISETKVLITQVHEFPHKMLQERRIKDRLIDENGPIYKEILNQSKPEIGDLFQTLIAVKN